MSNPYIIEYRDAFYSPSGFVDWMPAAVLTIVGMDMGRMLLVTDILFTTISVVLLWLWLRRVFQSRIIVWGCMFFLLSTYYGGALEGLLRDSTPKYTMPFFLLYLYMLALPSRGSLKQTLMRGVLIGVMYYTYPYHWTVCLVTEGLFVLHRLMVPPRESIRAVFVRGCSALVPFIVLALPLYLLSRSVLLRPEFADYYLRYHIVRTHIPAAPTLQLVVLGGLVAVTLWAYRSGATWRQRFAALQSGPMFSITALLLAMLILLNANIITGIDPEWLGHGARVIMPVVTVAWFAAVLQWTRGRWQPVLAGVATLCFVVLAVQTATARWQSDHENYVAWMASDERQVLEYLVQLPSEQVIAAPRALSERIPVFTSHYTSFAAGAHLFFVSLDELTDRYLGWVGLYPWEKELTDTATVVIFGNHPGAQWSKDRTVHNLLNDTPFESTMADYIQRQDLRAVIDAEHAAPDTSKTRERLDTYQVDVVIRKDSMPPEALLTGFIKQEEIGAYEVWVRAGN